MAVITGTTAMDILAGTEFDDTIDGLASADTMSGGFGNDIYVVDNIGDIVIESTDGGTDTIQVSFDYTLGTNIENLTLTGTALNGTGNALANVLTGNAYNNVLNGGAGADTMAGGSGNDVYYVDNAGDTVVESANYTSSRGTYINYGVDTVLASVDHTLNANIENLTLTGTAISGTGNWLDNVLTGNSAVNTLAGGLGNDTYIVQNSGDAIIEDAGAGTDSVQSSADYTLGANVENLTLTGAAVSGTGNKLNNVLSDNGAVNTLAGGLGNDTYYVQNTGDFVSENFNEGIDTVQSSVSYTLSENTENLALSGAAALNGTGNALNNVLIGNAYNNVLDGGAGADTMHGGGGNDIFYVNDAGDVVIEAATTTHCGACGGCGTVSGGTDTVWSSLRDYVLAANVENLFLLGGDVVDNDDYMINGTGNNLNNWLKGNGEENTLDGGIGADRMEGGQDEDIYIVDNVGDVVVEYSDIDAIDGLEHIDTVQSSVSYSLSAYVENLTLTGSAAINATGNSSDNVLTGNSAVNTLAGGLGNDTYMMDNTVDVIVENLNAGTDTVQSSVTYTLGANVENLTLTGAAAINGTGNALDNVLTGNAASNILTGGAGADIFVFNTALGASNVDTIADFTCGSDSLQLAQAMFGGCALGELSATAFVSGAGVTTAATADERIAYDTNTGVLYYDADGVGGADSVAFATLTAAPALAASDFAVA